MSKRLSDKNKGQVLIYQAEKGRIKLEVRLEEETVWLTQKDMAELYQTIKQNISLHIKNIYEEEELEPESTVKDSLTVQKEGSRTVKRPQDF